jgi:plastocyanin
MRVKASLFLIAAAALLAGCGGGSEEENATAMSGSGGVEAVTISDYLYEPDAITVPAGTEVTFTNEDAAPHTATSRDQGAFDSDSIATGESGSVTLEEAGTFQYYCAFHPFMKGTITVE